MGALHSHDQHQFNYGKKRRHFTKFLALVLTLKASDLI